DVQFRPHLFTFAIFSIVMATLATEIYQGHARLWPLIPLFALWANLHGGFMVGLGALGISAFVVGLRELWAGHRVSRSLRLGGITAGCALATLLNPFGAKLWPGVLHSMSDPMVRLFVSDWVSL